MPTPIADQFKVQKRKSEMGHGGSMHGATSDGYGKSPVVRKPKLVAAVSGVIPGHDLSPRRVGSKRRTLITQHPNSAPARDRKIGSLPSSVTPSAPALFMENDFMGKVHKSKSAKPLHTLSPSNERTSKTHADMPPGLNPPPNLEVDRGKDENEHLPSPRVKVLKRPSSWASSDLRSFDILDACSARTRNQDLGKKSFVDPLLRSIPEKGKSTKSTNLIKRKDRVDVFLSLSNETNDGTKRNASRSHSAPPGKSTQFAKHTSRPEEVVGAIRPGGDDTRKNRVRKSYASTSVSPGRTRAVVEKSKSLSSLSPKRSAALRTSGKSPTKSAAQYRRSVSDAGATNRSSRTNQQSKSQGNIHSSLERPSNDRSVNSRKHDRMPQAPMTWHHDNRDSRKLNSSNIGEKLHSKLLAAIPILDNLTTDADSLPRSSQRQPTNLRISSSSHHKRSLDVSRRSSTRGSSIVLATNQLTESPKGKRVSQSSHEPRSSRLTYSAHERTIPMSHSGHAKNNTISSNDVTTTAISKSSVRKSTHQSDSMFGSMVNLKNRVQESSIAISASSPGDREKATTMGNDDDSDGDSFANDDIEASGNRKKTGDEYLKDEISHAFHFLESTLGIEKKPPKTLVVVWILIVSELAFDFVTTVISFKVFTQGSQCCGYEMNLGRLPIGITVPFFFLVLAESLFLFIAITLTLWPSIFNKENMEKETKFKLLNPFMCCLTWNAKAVLYALNLTVILNPFFGCVIAWMLLYQSNKSQSFLVLGLEAGSIVLHFASVWLEGSCKGFKTFCFHCVQLVPFLTSVALILLYLRQGGICYLVDQGKFLFTGCELCPNNLAPIDNICQLEDGTNVTITSLRLWEVDGDLLDLADALTARAVQGRYCAADHPEGPNMNFCFFQY